MRPECCSTKTIISDVIVYKKVTKGDQFLSEVNDAFIWESHHISTVSWVL